MSELNRTTIKLMFVDDEEMILKSLKRLMSFEDYQCSFFTSAHQALAALKEASADIIVSDMRMPEMSGDQFLIASRLVAPDALHFILSGYADFNSVIHALNEGGVQRFIAKPWQDVQLLKALSEAADLVLLRKNHDRLNQLTKKQALQLQEANKTLEQQVAARTSELQQTADMLDLSFAELNQSYGVFIDVVAQVLQLRSSAPQEHINDISETAKALAAQQGCTDQEQTVVFRAAKLHELGKIRIPEKTLNKPLITLSSAEMKEYRNYPLQGFSLLASLDQLSDVSQLIRAHCEHYDGKGFPLKLVGKSIPLGSRIIAISMHYFCFRNGVFDGSAHSEVDAEAFIRSKAGSWVDPNLIEPFLFCVAQQQAKKGRFERRISLIQAEASMELSRDLFNTRGIIMLTKGTRLSQKTIEKLKFIAERDQTDYALYITSDPNQ